MYFSGFKITYFSGLKIMYFSGFKIMYFSGLKIMYFSGLKIMYFSGFKMAHLLDQTPSSSVEAAQLFASAAALQDGDDNEDYSTINRFIRKGVGLSGIFLIKMFR